MVNLKLQFPENFFQEEIRNDYLVSQEMKRIWAVELDLLAEFMRVCKKHNITFYGDAGTILGAARHGGMIPWDDDIDVMLLRDQYYKLCEIAPKEFRHPYFFQTEYTDPGSLRGHAQLRNSETTAILKGELKYKYQFNQGIFLDIFPIDNLPDNEKDLKLLTQNAINMRNAFLKKGNWSSRFASAANPMKSILKKIIFKITSGPLRLFFDSHQAYIDYEKEISKYNTINTKRVGKLVLLPFKPRRIWQRSWFESVTYLPFEFLEIPVPSGHIELLDQFYGDWHEFVVGTATHGGTFFDVEKPYTEYIK